MQHFFISPEDIEGGIAYIRGKDRHHIANVLRMRTGEELLISTGEDWDYLCTIKSIDNDKVELLVKSENETARELKVRLVLYQALPKSDKMELIIQKAVELGVHSIVPFTSKRVIVKLDEKSGANKTKRWQRISESAAKQSKRSIIPEVKAPISFKQMLQDIADYDKAYLAYEEARGTESAREAFASAKQYKSIAVCIGPEGGFEEQEIEAAQEAGFEIISLGSRILRTETAGFAVLSNFMIQLD